MCNVYTYMCVWHLDIPKGQAREKHVYNIVRFCYIEVLSIHFIIARVGTVVVMPRTLLIRGSLN